MSNQKRKESAVATFELKLNFTYLLMALNSIIDWFNQQHKLVYNNNNKSPYYIEIKVI